MLQANSKHLVPRKSALRQHRRRAPHQLLKSGPVDQVSGSGRVGEEVTLSRVATCHVLTLRLCVFSNCYSNFSLIFGKF